MNTKRECDRAQNLPSPEREKGFLDYRLGQDCIANGIRQSRLSNQVCWFELLCELWVGDQYMLLNTLHRLSDEQRTDMLRNQDQLLELVMQPLAESESRTRSWDRERVLVDRRDPELTRRVGPCVGFEIVPYSSEAGWEFPITRRLAEMFERMRRCYPLAHPDEVELLFEISTMRDPSSNRDALSRALCRLDGSGAIERNWPGLTGRARRRTSILGGEECSRSGMILLQGRPRMWYDLRADLPELEQRLLFYTLHPMDEPAIHSMYDRAVELGLLARQRTRQRVDAFTIHMHLYERAATLAQEIRDRVAPPLELLIVEESIACPGWAIPINPLVASFCDWLRDCYPACPQPLIVELLAMLSELGDHDSPASSRT